MTIRTIEAALESPDGRFAIVAGRWHALVVDGLLEGALNTLQKHGVKEENITLIRAPGAFEIPLVTQQLATSGKFDAIITLGAVIRGGTPHFEYVAGSCVDGISQVALDCGIPVAFGVLTVDNMEQALERIGAIAGSPIGNKGEEAALSALEMVNLLKKIR